MPKNYEETFAVKPASGWTWLLQNSVNWLPAFARHWIKHLPLVAPLQRTLVERFLSGQSFLHTINAGPAKGLRFEVCLPIDKLIWTGTYEPVFANAIAKAVRPGYICYDVGAHRGYMSGVMAVSGAAAVYAFEPLPENQHALRRLQHFNPELPIRVVDQAVGNVAGEAVLKVMPNSNMAKLERSPFQQEAEAEGELVVKVSRIDDLVLRDVIPMPNLLKIDVEGAELEVLLGAENTLKSDHPTIFLEAHSRALEDACTELLHRLGYKKQLISSPAEDSEVRHIAFDRA